MPNQKLLNLAFDENLHFTLHTSGLEEPLALGRIALWSQGENLLSGMPIKIEINAFHCEQDVFGFGDCQTAQGIFDHRSGSRLRLILTASQYPDYPQAVFLHTEIENIGDTPILIERFSSPLIQLGPALQPPLWSLQGAAVQWGQDFAFPLPQIFERENYLGHLDHAEGGGIPVIYFWNSAGGLGLAHVETQPQNWYMPVQSSQQKGISAALEDRRPHRLNPGEHLSGVHTMLSFHHGDFFEPLVLYRKVLAAQDINPAPTNQEDYEPAWCSWGYEFDVRPQEMSGVLPAVKDLDIHWLTLDDRWFDNYGDWNPRPDTFPGGELQMSRMVEKIHEEGAYAQIWWYPLAVEDGTGGYSSHAYIVAQILKEHHDWVILNDDGSVARNNRGLAILDPALPEVQEYLVAMTRKFIETWGFDGHKLDNIYTVPACYNPAHKHLRPEESVEALSEAYRLIFETTRRIKPYSVTQICPCGTPPTFSLLPYMDQAVTADPTSSRQIRLRVKFYKALLGPRFPVFADHVELSDSGSDFASEIGVGGIPATKFVWPEDPMVQARVDEWWGFSPEKRGEWKSWFEIYNRYRLSEGEYLNLYDLGFDFPEGHAIRKDERLYFAFYQGTREDPARGYEGLITLRGLEEKTYRVRDYIHRQKIAEVCGPIVQIPVEFKGYLLLEATPLL
jgi:alpha-galactosidase